MNKMQTEFPRNGIFLRSGKHTHALHINLKIFSTTFPATKKHTHTHAHHTYAHTHTNTHTHTHTYSLIDLYQLKVEKKIIFLFIILKQNESNTLILLCLITNI